MNKNGDFSDGARSEDCLDINQLPPNESQTNNTQPDHPLNNETPKDKTALQNILDVMMCAYHYRKICRMVVDSKDLKDRLDAEWATIGVGKWM
eukprot:Awhi_evm1s13460